ncbi:unnamed protein product [Cuscuta epithymum]|uniref:Uncharacterized protein n=1 Tax=Cuscuta epithymum TaxID=186058 RepID=A0AAV0FX09_9ASTE|nr:unnamed protein product [Cuscuta epithymum]
MIIIGTDKSVFRHAFDACPGRILMVFLALRRCKSQFWLKLYLAGVGSSFIAFGVDLKKLESDNRRLRSNRTEFGSIRRRFERFGGHRGIHDEILMKKEHLDRPRRHPGAFGARKRRKSEE